MNASLNIRGKNVVGLRTRIARLASGTPQIANLTREQFADQYGAVSEAIVSVHRFAARHGLSSSRKILRGALLLSPAPAKNYAAHST